MSGIIAETAAGLARAGQILPALAKLGVERVELAGDRLTIIIRQRVLLSPCGVASSEENEDS